jgi:fumarate hydratase, class I
MKELVELIRKCATDLPADVEAALCAARRAEDGSAADILSAVLGNVGIARSKGAPICQDTGTPIFRVTAPACADRARLRRDIVAAVRKATAAVPLRANAVDPVTGANSGDNTGAGVPVIHFGEWGRKAVRYELLLKGGGSENVTGLYRLPDPGLGAGRDMEGVQKCVLDAVFRAQGKGCPPYIVGVGLGGTADAAIYLSKTQLFRGLGDGSPDRKLAVLEAQLLEKINALGIGPMGMGGTTTALGVKCAKQHRHPATYFVGVSFSCWALRRAALEVRV